MADILRYLTHPQVEIVPDIPVPQWGLSKIGTRRIQNLSASSALANTKRVVSSGETKAIEVAEILAYSLGVTFEIHEGMHENDRSSTGFLESTAFEKMAGRFFTNPEMSVEGWEPASAAQTRIVSEAEVLLASHAEGDLLIVGHGAVGTLLYCHFANLPIDRKYDQMAGGGNFFAMDIASQQILHHWRAMEEM